MQFGLSGGSARLIVNCAGTASGHVTFLASFVTSTTSLPPSFAGAESCIASSLMALRRMNCAVLWYVIEVLPAYCNSQLFMRPESRSPLKFPENPIAETVSCIGTRLVAAKGGLRSVLVVMSRLDFMEEGLNESTPLLTSNVCDFPANPSF